MYEIVNEIAIVIFSKKIDPMTCFRDGRYFCESIYRTCLTTFLYRRNQYDFVEM